MAIIDRYGYVTEMLDDAYAADLRGQQHQQHHQDQHEQHQHQQQHPVA